MWWILSVTVALVVLLLALWCVWTATRLDRLHLQAASAQASLAAALARRSALVTEVSMDDTLDPASAVALLTAAATARDATPGDWQPQSDLSATIRAIAAESTVPSRLLIEGELPRVCREASMARRIHNDIVARALDLRQRRRVRWFHLAGHADPPRSIDFDDGYL